MEVFLIAAVLYWLAAPDPVTAGARTATGTAAKAAGAGVRDHWVAGRDGRALTRTKRRDRWSKGGGFWRNLLRLEHGAVITAKGIKGAAGITRAAVKPVPAAVKAGWVSGRDRHRAKAGNRPVPVALDPPWWRREQAQVQAAGTEQEQAPEQVQGGEQAEGTGDGDSPDRWRVIVSEGRRGYEGHVLLLDQTPDLPEQYIADVKGRTPEKVRENAEWLIGEEQRDHGKGKPRQIEWIDQAGDPGPRLLKADPDPTDTPTSEGGWDDWDGQGSEVREIPDCDIHSQILGTQGVPAAYDAETKAGPWAFMCPDCFNQHGNGALGLGVGQRLVLRADPTDPPTGTDPAGTTPPTEGDPVFTSLDTDLTDLTTVQDFALKVADMAEESDFAQLVEFCKNASDEVRDFGADMAGDVAEFEEVAAKIGDLLSELVDAATKVKDRGAELVGG